MPVTIKKSQLMYKNPSTGEYVSVDAVADKTSQQQINGINTAASNAIASINTAMQDIDTQPLTTLPKKAYKKDLVANEETLASAATHAYAVGDYFFVADNNNDISLYKATAAIAVGATISPGTGIDNNCVPAALANDVTSLSNDIDTVKNLVDAYASYSTPFVENLKDTNTTHGGISYSLSGNTLSCDGTSTSTSQFVWFGTTSSKPPYWFVGGEKYIISIDSTNDSVDVRFQIKRTPNTSLQSLAIYSQSGKYILDVPEDITVLRVVSMVNSGITLNNDTLTLNIERVLNVKSEISELRSGLGVLGIKNDLTWNNGSYKTDGTISTTVQYGNRYCNIIDATTFKKLTITPFLGRQVCLAFFDRTTGAFVSRSDYTTESVTIDNTYSVAINLATTYTDRTISTEDLLSLVEIYRSIPLSKWTGRKVAFVGDSITHGSYAPIPYHAVLNNMIGFSDMYVDGVAGSAYSVTATGNYTPISQRWQNIPTDRDLVVIFAGTNDWGHDAPIGTPADTTDVSMCGALSVVINGILASNPSARLVLITPLHRWGYTGGNYPNDTDNNGQGHPLADYVDAIKDMAQAYSIPVIDLFSDSGLNPRIPAISTAFFQDGLHPINAGHARMARQIASELEVLNFSGSGIKADLEVKYNQLSADIDTVKADLESVSDLKSALTDVQDAAFIATDNQIDFTQDFDKWKQGYPGGSQGYAIHYNEKIIAQAGDVIYGIIKAVELERTITMLIKAYNSNDVQVGSDYPISSTGGAHYSYTFPEGTSYYYISLTTQNASYPITPSSVKALNLEMYCGSTNVSYDNIYSKYKGVNNYIGDIETKITETTLDMNNRIVSSMDEVGSGSVRIYRDTWHNGYFNSTGEFIESPSYASPTNAPFLVRAGEVFEIDPDIYTIFVRVYSESGGTYATKVGFNVTEVYQLHFPESTYISLQIQQNGINPNAITAKIYKETVIKSNSNILDKSVSALGESRRIFNPYYFTVGGLDSGTYASQRYRVCAYNQLFSYGYPITIKAETGYEFDIHLFSSGVYESHTGWQTVYTIPANKTFKIVIKKTTETTSVVAEIDEFVCSITFDTEISASLENISETALQTRNQLYDAFGQAYRKDFTVSKGSTKYKILQFDLKQGVPVIVKITRTTAASINTSVYIADSSGNEIATRSFAAANTEFTYTYTPESDYKNAQLQYTIAASAENDDSIITASATWGEYSIYAYNVDKQPTGIEEEYNSTRENNEKAYSKNRISYAFLTDIHCDHYPDAKLFYKNELRLLIDIVNSSDVDFVVLGGDYINGANDKAQAAKWLRFVADGVKECRKPVIVCRGNHDKNNNASPQQASTEFITTDDFYTIMQAPFRIPEYKYDESLVGTGLYFYYDIPGKKTRVVVYDSIFNDDPAQQMKWLCEEALNKSDAGWNYIFVMHVPLNNKYNSGGMSWVATYGAQVEAIITALNGRTTYTGTAGTYSINLDFTGYQSNVIAISTGHEHTDLVVFDDTTDCFFTTTGCAVPASEGVFNDLEPDGNQTRGRSGMDIANPLKYLFDVFSVTPSSITRSRFGNGDDKTVDVPNG